MRIARIEYNDGKQRYAVKDGAEFRLLDGDPFAEIRLTGESVPEADARLQAPAAPRQIVAIGLNYRAHAREGGENAPEAPVIFVKTPNTVIGPDAPIVLPAMAPDEVDYECELVIVIGREAKNVPEADADKFILGYTCGNDVSARDCQLRLDRQWARGKCFDTFAPLGPWIETDVDPGNLRIRSRINGETMQDANTADMIFPPRFLVSYISRCMTLFPGSIIMTGTPAGVGFARKPPRFLREGDVVTVEIEGIGTLANPVVREQSRR